MMQFERTHIWRLLCAVSALIVFLLETGCNSRGASDNVTTAAPTAAPAPVAKHETGADKVEPASPAPTPAVAAGDSFATFEAFWPVFRSAVERDDKQRIVELTRFPFETRGDSDDDPVKALTREQFLQAFDSILKEDPGLLMNGKETEREHIARSATLTPRQYVSGDESARIGTFLFEKRDGRWWFTRAYVSDE